MADLPIQSNDAQPVNIIDGTVNTRVSTVTASGEILISDVTTSTASSNGTAITTATNTTAVSAPAANNHLRIYRIQASNSGSTGTWVYWRDGTSGTKLFPAWLPQNGLISLRLQGSFKTTGGATPNALVINTSAAGNVEWHVSYTTVAD